MKSWKNLKWSIFRTLFDKSLVKDNLIFKNKSRKKSHKNAQEVLE